MLYGWGVVRSELVARRDGQTLSPRLIHKRGGGLVQRSIRVAVGAVNVKHIPFDDELMLGRRRPARSGGAENGPTSDSGYNWDYEED